MRQRCLLFMTFWGPKQVGDAMKGREGGRSRGWRLCLGGRPCLGECNLCGARWSVWFIGL